MWTYEPTTEPDSDTSLYYQLYSGNDSLMSLFDYLVILAIAAALPFAALGVLTLITVCCLRRFDRLMTLHGQASESADLTMNPHDGSLIIRNHFSS